MLKPYADCDVMRISEVFVLRRLQTLHTSRVINCPRVECRRVATIIGAIYRTAYGTLSRRDRLGNNDNVIYGLTTKYILAASH